jgi:hypothetical protein
MVVKWNMRPGPSIFNDLIAEEIEIELDRAHQLNDQRYLNFLNTEKQRVQQLINETPTSTISTTVPASGPAPTNEIIWRRRTSGAPSPSPPTNEPRVYLVFSRDRNTPSTNRFIVKVLPTQTLARAFVEFSRRINVQRERLVFTFENEILNENDTPLQRNMPIYPIETIIDVTEMIEVENVNSRNSIRFPSFE